MDRSHRTGGETRAAKAPSDAAFRVYTPAISLDTSRFEHRLIPLSRTCCPFLGSGSTEPALFGSQPTHIGSKVKSRRVTFTKCSQSLTASPQSLTLKGGTSLEKKRRKEEENDH